MITEIDFTRISESCESISGMYHEESGKKCYELAKEMAIDFSKWVIDNRQYTVVGDAIIEPNAFELYIKSNK
jgi:hypothetical protein